jgi:hypothetical protein
MRSHVVILPYRNQILFKCPKTLHSFSSLSYDRSKPFPKRPLRILWSKASSFKWEYPLLSLMSFCSFLRLLPLLPFNYIKYSIPAHTHDAALNQAPGYVFLWLNKGTTLSLNFQRRSAVRTYRCVTLFWCDILSIQYMPLISYTYLCTVAVTGNLLHRSLPAPGGCIRVR